MPHPDRRAGFTLIEVLAALAITGALVSVALPYAARLATRWWVGERSVEVADGWMQALARLEDDLSQAMPLSLSRGAKSLVAFRSGPDFIEFVRPALGRGSATDLDTVLLDVRSTSRGMALMRRSGHFSADTFFAAPPSLGAPTTLIEGPFRLRFAVIDGHRTPQSKWEGDVEMPSAVQLSVVGAAGDAMPPGPILLPIVASAIKRTLNGGHMDPQN